MPEVNLARPTPTAGSVNRHQSNTQAGETVPTKSKWFKKVVIARIKAQDIAKKKKL